MVYVNGKTCYVPIISNSADFGIKIYDKESHYKHMRLGQHIMYRERICKSTTMTYLQKFQWHITIVINVGCAGCVSYAFSECTKAIIKCL